ncbi:MAG TPA: hypothetical protein VIL99_04775 [Ignavibacteria bacterium]
MTLNETLDILNIYRNRLKSQYEKPGWNKWALFGALASLIWILISLKSENNLETKDSFKLLIVLIFSETIIYQLQKLLYFSSKKIKTTYIVFKKEISHRSLVLVFVLITFLSIIIYSNKFILFPHKEYNYIYYSYLYLSVFIYVISPIFGLINFPFPVGRLKSKKSNYFKNVFLVAMFTACISSIYFLILIIQNWNIYNMWKSSFVFFGLYFVIQKIFETLQKTPLIDEIDYIIDEVTFNKMNSDTAINNLKLIIKGLEFKDAFSPLLIEYFNIEKTVRDKMNYITQIFSKTQEEKDAITRLALLKELTSNIDQCKKNEIDTLIKFAKKVSLRIDLYKQFDHDPNEMLSTIKELDELLIDFLDQNTTIFLNISKFI